MASHYAFGHRLPRPLANPLFGDRETHGLVPVKTDPCWTEWQRTIEDFYDSTQKKSLGARANDAGYQIMKDLSLSGLRVLEIGPGNLDHRRYWRDRPREYVLVDIADYMLDRASAGLTELGVAHTRSLTDRAVEGRLPVEDESVDMITTFYSLEHLWPLDRHLEDMERVLRPGGRIVGAIPAEGGMMWGLGRYFTSRRWLKANTTIDPDKIICWEHPNFADEILTRLDTRFERKRLDFWPFSVPLIDMNAIIRFSYEKQ